MKNKADILRIILLLVLLIGCATGPKSPETLAKEYTAKAQQYEKQGDLVEALKQYRLVLTVDPANQLAREKTATLEPQLKKLAEEHYKSGIKFYCFNEMFDRYLVICSMSELLIPGSKTYSWNIVDALCSYTVCRKIPVFKNGLFFELVFKSRNSIFYNFM